MDWAEIIDILKEAAILTAVVVAMMMLIEVLSYKTEGRIVSLLRHTRTGNVLASAFLGAIPGCVGGYITVSMYKQRLYSFGALLAMALATTGDEAFVMLAMYPKTALLIFAGLLVLGIAVGMLWDRFFSANDDISVAPQPAGDRKSLRERLRHTAGHAVKIFLWALGVMLLTCFAEQYIDLATWVNERAWLMIPLAVLIGLIPQSGPHLIFVTLFASGIIPLPVLLASCIVQEGHAGIPLLADDKRAFVRMKAVKCVLGLAVGYIALLF